MKYCPRCAVEDAGAFCPRCGGLMSGVNPLRRAAPASRPGDRFLCAIWSGDCYGLLVGAANRERFFRRDIGTVIVYAGKKRGRARLAEAFWVVPDAQIREALDEFNTNILDEWIGQNDLSPRRDAVGVEVLAPEREFRLFLPDGDDLASLARPAQGASIGPVKSADDG